MLVNDIRPKHIGYAWSANKVIGPCILSVTRSICEAGLHERHESSEWILDYSYTPFGRYKVGRESAIWKERKPFEAHLYLPRTPYWENTISAGVPRTCGIFMSFREGNAIFDRKLTQRQYVCFLDPAQRLGRLLERLLETGLAIGDSGFANAQAVFWEIIALLNTATMHKHETRLIPAEDDTPPISDFLHKVRAYLHEHLAERVTREELASHLKVSVSALAHRYHNETGEMLMTTLTRMRIHVAKSLLLKGEPLKLIADQTGFYDEFHLSRTFKRFEGISARDFRCRQMHRRGPSKLLL